MSVSVVIVAAERTLQERAFILPLKGPEGLVDRVLGLYQPLGAGRLNGRPVVQHALREVHPAVRPAPSVNVFAPQALRPRPNRAANDRV